MIKFILRIAAAHQIRRPVPYKRIRSIASGKAELELGWSPATRAGGTASPGTSPGSDLHRLLRDDSPHPPQMRPVLRIINRQVRMRPNRA